MEKALTAIQKRYEPSMSETAFTDAICAAYDLGRAASSFPSQPATPRCPKCEGEDVDVHYRKGGWHSLRCGNCRTHISASFQKEAFAQFFPPSSLPTDELIAIRNTIKLIIGQTIGKPWMDVPDSEVDRYVEEFKRLSSLAQKEGRIPDPVEGTKEKK